MNCKFTMLAVALLTFATGGSAVYASGNGEIDSAVAVQQSGKASGQVVGEDGPIIGAVVVVKDTNKAAVTDGNGRFVIENVANGATLSASFMGYLTKDVVYNGQSEVTISLEVDALQVDEVVVVAYGTARKSTLTGSASVVKAEDLGKISGAGFAESLQGMSAGVNVVNVGGNPGGESTITIRGIGTMMTNDNKESSPLIILDGMPYDGKLTSISPQDIESMTVLKDASASSLYGSRAANGVITITTKKGRSEKPTVNFRAQWGTSNNAVKNPTTLANPGEHLTNIWGSLYNDAYYVNGMSQADAGRYASDNVVGKILASATNSAGQPTYVSPFKHVPGQDYVLPDGTLNPDLEMVWDPSDYEIYDIMYSEKLRQEYNFDISGVTKDRNTSYYFSAAYLDDQGYGHTQYFKRYGFRSNITSKVTDWLELGGNLAYSNSKQNLAGSFQRAAVYTSQMSSPYLRNADNTDWVYSEKTGERMLSFGNYITSFFGANVMGQQGDYWDNPGDHSFSNEMANMISSRMYADFTLPLDLKFKTSLSLDNNSTTSYNYSSAVHGGAQQAPYGYAVMTNGGWAGRGNTNMFSTTWNNVLSYNKTFGKHSINALIGQEYYATDYNYNGSSGSGIMQPGQFEVGSTTKEWSADSYRDKYALFSIFANVNYGFNDKYFISGSYRRDGSSRFHEDNRWGDFWSVGGSWRISQEEFMKNINWVNSLALRASFGTTGNDNIGTYYAYQNYYSSLNMYETPGLQPNSLPTPELIWEKNEQFNVGIDFSLLNYRLFGTIEYYTRSSKDLLYQLQLPYTSQVGSANAVNTNLGDIKNSGIEVTLGGHIIQNDNFTWTINGNWSSLKNEITYLPNGSYTTKVITSTYKLEEGKSRWEFFMPINAGVNPDNGNMQYWITNDAGERVITENWTEVGLDDYEYIGSALPKGYGSFTNSFEYKGFDLSFMFYYSYGSYMNDYIWKERTSIRPGNSALMDFVEDSWTKPGDIATFPRSSNADAGSTLRATDFYVFKNNYLRLRNLTLGYTLPSKITDKMKMQNLRVYVTGDNLLTFGAAAKRYSDPETGMAGDNYNGDGSTDSGLPSSRRVFMGGIQFTF